MVYISCTAVFCAACNVMFGPDDAVFGEYGTITLVGAGGRLAAPSGTPLDFAAFSEYRLTVRRGSTVVGQTVAQSGGYNDFATSIRSAKRRGDPPEYRAAVSYGTGFQVSRAFSFGR